jgi:serine/threonine protein phosphatase PrpC/tetratricopeptide (TPR) repeat protein
MSNFLLNVSLEVSSGSGEDCHLILNGSDNDKETCVIGVFDGLGGRSAGFDGLKGGQIASKEASQIVQKILSQWNGRLTEEIAHQIQSTICQHLKLQADAKMPKSRLSGTLTGKRLCTTIALASISKREESIYDINLVWMGDSRIYFLSSSQGLQQLTVDDLEVKKDAFEMIREDPPMSQYLTADIPSNWRIHHNFETIEECGCILACTDGCFQYLPTPWDFEKLLIETLINANSPAEWETSLVERYNQIKQDDVSLILIPFGFTDFGHIQESYRSRNENLVAKYNNVSNDIESLRQLWDTYRINYESKLKVNIVTVEEKESPDSQAESGLLSSEYVPQETTKNHSQNDEQAQTPYQRLVDEEREKATMRSPELPPISSSHTKSTHESNLPDVADQVSSLLKKAREYKSYAPNKAIQQFYKVLELDPNNTESFFELGILYLDIKQPLEAINYLQRVVEVASDKYLRNSIKLLAEAYHQADQHHQSVIYFAKLYPNLEEPYMGMYAKSLMEDSRLEEAIFVCESIRSRHPHDPYAFYLIGHIRHKQNILAQAEEFLNWARKLYQNLYNKTRSHTHYEKLQIVEREFQEVRRKQN